MKRISLVLATIAAGVALLRVAPTYAGPDEESIRHLLHSTFDKPESRLVVEPVVVSGDHALAGWSQGDMGGRALLRNRGGTWSLILCSGDGITSAEALRQAGVAPGDATALSFRLGEAERKLAPERLALFAKFEGTMMMDASGGHPQHPPMRQEAQMNMSPPHASSFKVGNLVVEAPWVRATPQGAQVAGGYMKITNTGKEADRLIGGTIDHARRFEIHEMTMVDNVMRMRPLPNGLEIKPGETVELKPGGYHIMGLDPSTRIFAGADRERYAEVREGRDGRRGVQGVACGRHTSSDVGHA
jgi:copper(I)-binding protein